MVLDLIDFGEEIHKPQDDKIRHTRRHSPNSIIAYIGEMRIYHEAGLFRVSKVMSLFVSIFEKNPKQKNPQNLIISHLSVETLPQQD